MAALTAEAYSTASQAASALHAMAILQVHQVKALKQMNKGSSDPRLMQELRLVDLDHSGDPRAPYLAQPGRD